MMNALAYITGVKEYNAKLEHVLYVLWIKAKGEGSGTEMKIGGRAIWRMKR